GRLKIRQRNNALGAVVKETTDRRAQTVIKHAIPETRQRHSISSLQMNDPRDTGQPRQGHGEYTRRITPQAVHHTIAVPEVIYQEYDHQIAPSEKAGYTTSQDTAQPIALRFEAWVRWSCSVHIV